MPDNGYSIIFAPAADRDLVEIACHYVSLGSLGGARRISAKIAEATENIRFMPYIGAVHYDPDGGKTAFRKVIVEKYLIFYKVLENEKTVVIYRVLNGTSDYIEGLRDLYSDEDF